MRSLFVLPLAITLSSIGILHRGAPPRVSGGTDPGFAVLAVDEEGLPLAQAELRLTADPIPNDEDWAEFAKRARDYDELRARMDADVLPRTLANARTGADGHGRFASSPSEPCLLEASTGALYGRARIAAANRDEIRVVLRRDETAWVRVVDARGAPVPHVITSLGRYEPPSSVPPGSESKALGAPALEFPAMVWLLWSWHTGEQGEPARIEHVQELFRRPEDRVGLRAWPYLPGLNAGGVFVDPDALAGSTLEIVLPETASLAVRLVREDGEPVPLGSRVMLEVGGDEPSVEVPGVGPMSLGIGTFLEVAEDALASYPRVRPRTPLHLTGIVDGLPFATKDTFAPGPGERLEVELAIPAAR